MKQLIIAISSLFICRIGIAQSEIGVVKVFTPKREILDKDKISVDVIFYPGDSKNISVLENPVFSDFDSEISGIQFRIDRLVDSCFSVIYVTTDFFSLDIDTSKVKLKNNDPVVYHYNISNIYSFRKNQYRMKVFFIYFIGKEFKIAESKWQYFSVIDQ